MHAFDVLGDPVRRRILELLAGGEQSAGEVVSAVQAEFGITQPAVSQHLRVLREHGFTTVRPEGARRLYAVAPSALDEIDTWVDAFRRRWAQPLDALATELARGQEEQIMIDIDHQVTTVDRRVADRTLPAGEGRVVTIGQSYDATVEELWDAGTSAERIPRWLTAISGDLELGGHYQLEGNAGGTITECDPPHRFAATWE